jgi:hypothetical protein
MASSEILQDLLTRLRTPIHEQHILVENLIQGLQILGLSLPVSLTPSTSYHGGVELREVIRYIPKFQLVLVENIIPHWVDSLRDSGHIDLIQGYFLPIVNRSSSTSTAKNIQRECIIAAHASLLVSPISQFSIDLLAQIHTGYPPNDIFGYIIRGKGITGAKYPLQQWGDYIDSLFQTSGKVMNAAGERKMKVPDQLYSRYDLILFHH